MKTPTPFQRPDLRTLGGLFGHRERGFTLVELLIVVVIMGILMAVGIPSLTELVRAMRVKNASFDVYASIVAARSEAITRNTTVTITPTSGTNWAAGWNVVATTALGPVTVKTQDAFPNLTMTGPATLVYNNSGRITTANNCTGNVCISLTAPTAVSQDGRCVTLDLSGRPVSAKGVCP